VLASKWKNEIEQEKKLRTFFEQNYGAPSVDVGKVFSLERLKVDRAVLDPKFAGGHGAREQCDHPPNRLTSLPAWPHLPVTTRVIRPS